MYPVEENSFKFFIINALKGISDELAHPLHKDKSECEGIKTIQEKHHE